MKFFRDFLGMMAYITAVIATTAGIIVGVYHVLRPYTEYGFPVGCGVALIVLTSFAFALDNNRERS